MPQNTTQAIRDRKLEAKTPDPVAYKPAAQVVDTYAAPPQTNSALQLAGALTSFNKNLEPLVTDRLNKIGEDRYNQGLVDKAQGKDATPDAGEVYMRGYMAMSGRIKGQEDLSWLQQKIDTEYDHSQGTLESFINQQFHERIRGIDDPSFLKHYAEAFTPGALKVREDYLKNFRQGVVDDVESNAMTIMEQGIRGYIDSGQPIDQDFINGMRTFLASDMGVSGTRYNDLVFATMKRIGDEGNYAIYDTLKERRPDGTPGMYFIPGWKEKIDQAQLHALNVYTQRLDAADKAAKKAREDAIDKGLQEVFMEPDRKKRQMLWEQKKKEGLFQGAGADQYFTWEKKMDESLDGKPNIAQGEKEVELLTGIIQRRVKTRDILTADLTLSQRRYLLNELEQAHRHDQSMAKDRSNDIFKTPEFKMGEEYIKSILRPQATALDPMGIGSDFDRQQMASAVLEYNRRAQGVNSPAELHAIREEIVTRYQNNKKGKTVTSAPHPGRLRYTDPKQLRENASGMTADELELQIKLLQQGTQP